MNFLIKNETFFNSFDIITFYILLKNDDCDESTFGHQTILFENRVKL